MLDISDIPQVDLGSPGPAADLLGDQLRALMDFASAAAAASGVKANIAIGQDNSIVLAAPFAINVKNHGAKGDGATNDTASVASAITALRNAGAGVLFFPRGTYLLDSFNWDWIAGGYGKFVLAGEGSASVLKKRVNDSVTFATIGRDDTTQTFQGSVYVRDICFDGVSGGSHNVLELWSLTTFKFENVRVRYGSKAWQIRNCVTGILENCQGSDATRGLDIDTFTFPDTTTSKSNVITLIGGAYKDSTEWGIVFAGGSDLAMLGVQVENNGTVATIAGGLYVKSTAGSLGTNRKGRGVIASGCWFESNSGKAGVIVEGGASTFEGCQFVANSNATRDLYNNGGKYTLVDCSMVNAKTGGNIEDTASAQVGNIIIGGEIVDPTTSTDATKTDLYSVSTGNSASPVQVTRVNGKAKVASQDTTEKMIVHGADGSASGATVTFPTAFKTGTTPRVVATVGANEPTKVQSVKTYNVSATGFTVEKTEMANGSNTVSTASFAINYIAIGQAP